MRSIGLTLAALTFVLPASASAHQAFDPTRADRPIWSPIGDRIAFSDTESRGVYLYDLRGGELLTMTQAPSSGYTVRWSPDGRRLAFKLLVEDSRRPLPWQAPAIFDLEARRLVTLADLGARAGVPSFAASGELAFSLGDRIVVYDRTSKPTSSFPIGGYANLTPLSPDGALIAFNDADDAIWLLDAVTGRLARVTDEGAWHDPIWSPDGRRLLLHGVSGRLACVDLGTGTTAELPRASRAIWLPDGATIVYASQAIPDVRTIPDSDLWIVRHDGTGVRALTSTPNVRETSPAVSPDGRTLVYRVDGQGLVAAPLVTQSGTGAITLGAAKPLLAGLRSSVTWRPAPGELPASPAVVPQLAQTQLQGVTYLHQVYDTRDDFAGSWACGATSAMMTIAWRGIVPAWDMTASWPSPHASPYGNYISEVYSFGGFTFDVGSEDPDGDLGYGGYGYITQNDWEDTKGHMAEYIRYHGLESSVDWSPSWDELTGEIAAGMPFVILSSITTSGHYTVAIGHYTDQHSVIFNDPYGNKNEGYMNYNGAGAAYDWPGYNNGLSSLDTVHCFIYSRGSAQPGALSGTVRDSTTGAAIVGATVAVDAGASAQTGPDGTYTIAGLPPGAYTATATATCYAVANQPASVDPGGTTTSDFALLLDGSCPTTGTIQGHVTDGATGAPLTGATVTLAGAGTGTATTDATGLYQVSGLTPGDYTIAAQADCFAPGSTSATVTAGGTATAELALVAQAGCGDPVGPTDPDGPGYLSGGCGCTVARGASGSPANPVLLALAGAALAILAAWRTRRRRS